MWCHHCQQDVPAAAARAGTSPSCARCRREFADASPAVTARPIDCGVELAAFEPLAAGVATKPPQALADPGHDPLAALASKLKPRRRIDPAFGRTAAFRSHDAATAPAARAATHPPRAPSAPPAVRQRPAWGIALLLWGGMAVFAGGAGGLAWSAAFALETAWHWSLSATLLGEGLLIVGLALAAIRLWRNSRRLNRQLDGVGAQLDEIGDMAGRLAHARMSCSQAYYEHFGATTSPSLAMANLRGQLEQLAARIER
ncbi:MAG: hypothetical protein KDA44_03215 [Planctomycetales bacterium]|nr:hypothetical protein [Planctomycetales bacterium]